MTHEPNDPRLSDFDRAAYHFELPARAIAQEPPPTRDASRLLVIGHPAGTSPPVDADPLAGVTLAAMREFPQFLGPDDLLVLNTTAVAPTRFYATSETGGRVEVLVLSESNGRGEALMRAGRPIRAGEILRVVIPDLSSKVVGESAERGSKDAHIKVMSPPGVGGVREVEFVENFLSREVLDAIGVPPLPPYIKRAPDDPRLRALDRERYQTVYADTATDSGFSAAAPTAGLHFTPELLAEANRRCAGIVRLQLHVGMGTFSPVKADDVRQHAMHAEQFRLDGGELARLVEHRRANRPIICVGTTSARVLETLTRVGRIPAASNRPHNLAVPGGIEMAVPAEIRDLADGGIAGETRIFVHPPHVPLGFEGLLTNFHLPESTLMMFVAARLGRARTLAIYRHAVALGLKFFSYGDAMLIRPEVPLPAEMAG